MQFKDKAGREWPLRITWAAMRRAAAAGVDLSMIEQHLGDFHRGSPMLIEALWAICGPEARALGIDQDQFEAGIFGDVLTSAREALIAAIVDFFPSDRGRLVVAAERSVTKEMASLSRKLSTESPAN